MNQTDFSEVADCSASTIQAIELGRLNLSQSLARKISVATNISGAWLLKNDLKSPPVTAQGNGYTREEYAKAQMAFTKQQDPFYETYIALALYARVRAITSQAAKIGWGEYQLAMYDLDWLLVDLRKKYGWNEELCPIWHRGLMPPFASVLSLIRQDMEAMEAEILKAADAPDRKLTLDSLENDPAYENAKNPEAYPQTIN